MRGSQRFLDDPCTFTASALMPFARACMLWGLRFVEIADCTHRTLWSRPGRGYGSSLGRSCVPTSSLALPPYSSCSVASPGSNLASWPRILRLSSLCDPFHPPRTSAPPRLACCQFTACTKFASHGVRPQWFMASCTDSGGPGAAGSQAAACKDRSLALCLQPLARCGCFPQWFP